MRGGTGQITVWLCHLVKYSVQWVSSGERQASLVTVGHYWLLDKSWNWFTVLFHGRLGTGSNVHVAELLLGYLLLPDPLVVVKVGHHLRGHGAVEEPVPLFEQWLSNETVKTHLNFGHCHVKSITNWCQQKSQVSLTISLTKEFFTCTQRPDT